MRFLSQSAASVPPNLEVAEEVGLGEKCIRPPALFVEPRLRFRSNQLLESRLDAETAWTKSRMVRQARRNCPRKEKL